MTQGRPIVPILSRERIVDVALEIIDEEGLDALTTRRLADELGVKGASLYNHFSNKQEIVLAVAERVLGQMPRKMIAGRPEDLLVWGTARLRKSLLAHPELTSVMAHQRETGLAVRMLDAVAERLLEDGVPASAIMPLLESLERFAIGSAIREVNSTGLHAHHADSKHYPSLALAVRSQSGRSEDIYTIASHGIIEALLKAAQSPGGFEAAAAQYRAGPKQRSSTATGEIPAPPETSADAPAQSANGAPRNAKNPSATRAGRAAPSRSTK